MSRQDSWQPRNLDVADMRGLNLLAVRQKIVRGLLATRLLITSTPSIMKMDVAPVSAMAWSRAIVTAVMT